MGSVGLGVVDNGPNLSSRHVALTNSAAALVQGTGRKPAQRLESAQFIILDQFSGRGAAGFKSAGRPGQGSAAGASAAI